MAMSAWKRAGVCLTAAAVVAGVAGCQDGDGGGKKAAGSPDSGARSQSSMTEVLQAAYKKTSEVKSAKVRITMAMPAAAGGGTTEISGVQGWDPGVMDVTMKGSALAAGDPEAPEPMRMIMLDDVMYINMGAKQAAEMDGKQWMKMDFGALAEKSGDADAQRQMTQSLQNMNQDPAQQLALLLESPNLKHVGPEKVDGVETEHYKGTLSVQEMLEANQGTEGMLSKKERQELVDGLEKAGMKGYDTEVWVNEDDLPVKMVVGMKFPQGTMKMTAHYSDYGTKADVQAPPAGDTFDFMEMLEELERLGGQSGAGLGEQSGADLGA
ncbi:lipoprotein [Streptomyces thermocarboxydovorans]|uniref:Lipoprotein n=1 Tax=Streptomyces thermocarboxydovorans TaxID=59298 RepID=A0ABN1H7F7_9ACTN